MGCDDDFYLDVDALRDRGWTDTLIRRFLGEPDEWKPVDHFRNFTGKRTYWLERVEAAEGSAEFDAAYRASLKRRRIDPELEATFQSARASTAGAVQEWRRRSSPEEARTRELLARAAAEIQDARRRGARTPHRGG